MSNSSASRSEGPTTRDGSTNSGSAPSLVFAIVCVGTILPNLDLFSVTIALPRMADDFKGARLEDLSWILNAYAIAYAALLVFFGRVAEGFRRDRSFILGIAIFTLAAAACAAASSVWEMVALRVLAAAGAALMTPTSLGLLLATFAPERRGAAVRNWAAIGGFASALGPIVGGLLVSINWRWIFLLNAVVGLVAIALAWRSLPHVPGQDVKRPSLLGALLATAGISALVFTIIKINTWGWQSPAIGASAAAAVALLGLFVTHSLRAPNPLVDHRLFWIRDFNAAALTMFPYSLTFGAMLFSVSVWNQAAWGWTALQTALLIIPGPLLVPFTSMLFTNKLIGRFGIAGVVTIGIVFVIVGFGLWATFLGLRPNAALIVAGMVLNGIGVGLLFPTLMGVSTQALPPSSFATDSGVINMIRQTAMAIGVAIFVAIIGSPASPQARLEAFQVGWWVMAAITALALIPTFSLLRPLDRRDN